MHYFSDETITRYNLLGKAFKFQFCIVIDNKTMQESVFFSTNYHFDYGISDNSRSANKLYNMHVNKKQLKQIIHEIRKGLNRQKPKLIATDNDINYTRLIYAIN